MSNKVKLDAAALRAIMGEAFDWDKYEEGRRDTRSLFREQPELREEKLNEIRCYLESGEYKHTPGPSYWVGCLCEADFT